MSRVRKEPYSGAKKIMLLFFAVALIFVLLFGAAKGKYQFPFSEKIVVTVVAPVQSLFMEVGNRVRGMSEWVWKVVAVYQQNEMLDSEVKQLRAMNIKLQEVMAENERLRLLLQHKQTTPQFDFLTATVVARDPGNWTSSMLINRGSQDGITKDMVVVTVQGLVGNIVEVFNSTARVQLILDPRSSVGAIVQRPESRVAGIVEGDRSNKMMGRMVNIPRDADVAEGDRIMTSGFGGIYPKGISIGLVEKIENDEGGLLKYALVKPDVDFQKIEEVSVIIRSREAPPAPLTAPPVPQAAPPGGKQ